MATQSKSKKKSAAAKSGSRAKATKATAAKKPTQKSRPAAAARPAKIKPNPELSQSVLVLTFIFTLLCIIFMAVAFYSYN